MLYTGKEWGTVLRFWADGLQAAYQHYVDGEGVDRQKRLRKTVDPTLHGAGVLMIVSLVERLVLDLIQATQVSAPDTVRLSDAGWRRDW